MLIISGSIFKDMKIFISGINGYLGSLIADELCQSGYEVHGISRSALYGSVSQLSKLINGCDVVINLAGAPILQRWSKKNKQTILDSRVITTSNLVSAINQLPKEQRPERFISASAIGIYRSGATHDENSIDFDNGFVGSVVKSWEKPLDDLPQDVQKIVFRIGLVLGKKAQTITKMLLPFKLGLGASIGNGKQAFPFVHEMDLVRAFIWAVKDYTKNSVFNLTAPENISNKTFTKTFAKQLKRPAFFFIPGFILKLLFGEAAVLLTESPTVSSEKIIQSGFEFEYPDIESTLNDILS